MRPQVSILISAAEASSCLHALHLVRALQQEAEARGFDIKLFGTGDARMKQIGFDALVDAGRLQAMGTTEVLGRLPAIIEAGKILQKAASDRSAQVAVLMDYPDFHLRLAEKLRAQRVACISYIPPKVWIWRKSRMKKMKALFERILCIFPFEEKLYREAGLQADYVGNPLVEELPLDLSREAARKLLLGDVQITDSDRVVAFLPGSRPGELSRHIPELRRAASLALSALRERLGQESRLLVLVPFANQVQCDEWAPGFREGDPAIEYHFFVGRSAECMVAADAGLIKSGTATLEAGVLGLPHAVFYKVSGMTAWIFRNFVQKKNFWSRTQAYQGPVGLVNLFTGWKPGDPLRVPEYLLEDATGERLGEALTGLLFDAEERARQSTALRELRTRVLGQSEVGSDDITSDRVAGMTPSLQAARRILDLAQDRMPAGKSP